MKLKLTITVTVIMCLYINVLSQSVKVRGIVYDKETNDRVSFASIALNDNKNGTISDINGEFYIERKTLADSLYVSFVGYKTAYIPIKQGSFNEIDIYLETANIEIDEVTITPGENPAHAILRNIRKNKEKNRPDNLETYKCEVYNKMELDVNNLDLKFRNRKALNQFQFVFDNIDTSALTGKSYLPMFITETVSDYYFQAPNTQREVIKASKIAGIEEPSLSQFTGIVFQKVDIYENFMEIIAEGFVSPIADFGLLYYKYYLIDSIIDGNRTIYNITYEPKRKSEKTFSGFFMVDKESYAITSIKMKLNEGVNINYVNDFAIQLDFTRIYDSIWFLSKEYYEVEFNVRDKGKGFVGKKTTFYSKVIIEEPFPAEIKKMYTKTKVKHDAAEKTIDYWQLARPAKLSPKELKIYSTIDSMKKVPVFKAAVNWVNMFTSYHYDFGWFEYGPYYKTMSYNEIEGYRIRLGGRTSSEFSKKHRFNGHLAYGFMDERVKFGFGYINYIKRYPWTNAGFTITHDIKQLGQSINAFTEDNIMTSFLRRNPNYKLTMVNKYEAFFEKEWFEGLSNKIIFRNQEVFPTQYIPFNKINENNELIKQENVVSSEITLNTRFALHEQFVYATFERINITTNLPIINFDFSIGIPNLFNSQYKYYKTVLSVKDKLEISPFGYFRFLVEGGKIFGELPYTLLELHQGNETYAYDIYAYNRMNYYEFVSDEYVKLLTEQHFMGFFFNKFPLINKLKLREVLYGQALFGRLNQNHENAMLFPEGLSSLSGPYIEAGIGIENILKLIRVDAVWRLTHTDKPQNVILMLSLRIEL
ncbi:DUF5686 family protein [Bacteroidota bacterium]